MKVFKFILSSIQKFPVHVGNNFETQDAAETPVISPKTLAAAGTQKITIPANAAEVVLSCDDDVQICKDANFTTYDRIPGGVPTVLQVAKLNEFYLKNGGTASVDIYFRFVTL